MSSQRAWASRSVISTVTIVGLVSVCLIATLALIGQALKRPRESRIEREIAFLQIGKKVAAQIRAEAKVPQSAEALRQTGWLSSDQWYFFVQNKVTYTPPDPNAGEAEIILRMPYEGAVNLVVQMDGFMRKDYEVRKLNR
jgi:hypothetical protein